MIPILTLFRMMNTLIKKKAWSKMNEQIELIYNDLQENGIKEGSPRFSLDLLRQYSDAFYSYIN